MMPGDNENNASEVLSYYGLVREVDILVPFIHNLEVRDIRRRFISSAYRLIINISFGTQLNYTNGTVIYNKAAVLSVELVSTGFFYQTELLIKLIRRGFLYAEVPQFLGVRYGGKSSALTMYSFLNLSWSFIQLAWNIHILRSEGVRSWAASSFPPNTCTRRKYQIFNK